MSWSTKFRIGLFEFLALPADLWLRLCAFLIGAKWVSREFKVGHDYQDDDYEYDYEDDDPPWSGANV
jgi:hypothetical protein